MTIGSTNLAKITTVLLFILLWVNPYTEKLNGNSALVFMFSHYSLCLVGLLVGIFFLKWPKGLWFLGIALLTLWHLPLFFALSAKSYAFRVPEEATIFLGGLFIGSNFHTMKSKMKIILFVIWIVADTALSAIFIVAPFIYSDVPSSPFAGYQFIITGVAMVFFMNGVIAYVVYLYVKRFQKAQALLSKNANNTSSSPKMSDSLLLQWPGWKT